MKKVFTRIMASFLTMTLILLNIPVTLLAASGREGAGGNKDTTEFQISVLYDSRQVYVEGDDRDGCIRFYDQPHSKTVGAYGSVWLTLTQYEIDNFGKVDFNRTVDPTSDRRAIRVKLHEVYGSNNNVIAVFDPSNGLGQQYLPNYLIGRDPNIQDGRYGCKIMLRPPINGDERTYYFEIETADGKPATSTGKVTLQVKEIDKPLLVPPTIGRTDGFSRTKDNASDQSSVQVYVAKDDIRLEGGTPIEKGTLLIKALRDESILSAKKAELKSALDALSAEELEIYERAIDYRSMDPDWTPRRDTSYLADLRVSRESVQFVTNINEAPKVAYDRNYISEIPAILTTKKDQVHYKSIVEASVWHTTLSSGLYGLDGAIAASPNRLLIAVATDQRDHFEDTPTKGAVNNKYLWENVYTAGESVIKYTEGVDIFFTEVKLNIVALYTGSPSETSRSYANKNVRAFIFTDQSGQQAGNWFPEDAPIPDVRAMEIPRWSEMLTKIRQKDDQFQVYQATQDLRLYPEGMEGQTIIAARYKDNFVGVDSRVDKYGENSFYYINGDKSATPEHYANYYEDFGPKDRFYPGTTVFTPAGILGKQIGYRIVYEQYLLDTLKRRIPQVATCSDPLNALNALIAMDSDAFEYYTGLRLTQMELNTHLYEMVGGTTGMAEEFMIDSVQDFTPLATTGSVGTVTYRYGLAGGDSNYIIPDGNGCLSYIFKVEDAGLYTGNLVSRVTTTIDFDNAIDSVYDSSSGSYQETEPQVKIDTTDTSAFKFVVEKYNGTKYVYDPVLTSAISGSSFAGGVLTIKFDLESGEYFSSTGDYKVSVIFPVTLEKPLNVDKYKNGPGTDQHLPVREGGTSHPRSRVITTNTVVEYQKAPARNEETGELEVFDLETKGPDEVKLQLTYKDFVKIQ